ncbi:MAG: DUF4124 domain-containing protein, partial [Nitrospinae bacterium]|nr:DUF4124 domain-containing protein [Nitrospinota bacterium]
MRFILSCVLIWTLLFSGTVQAEIYTWTDKSGKEHFTDSASQLPTDPSIKVKVIKGTSVQPQEKKSKPPAESVAPPAKPAPPVKAKAEAAPKEPEKPPVDQKALQKKLKTYQKLTESIKKIHRDYSKKIERLKETGSLGGGGTNRASPEELQASFERETKRLAKEIKK